MGLLVVRETLKDGRTKTWKVENTKKVFSWGRSSRADILSINPENPPYIGFFEYRNDNWHINFFENKNIKTSIEIPLDKKFQLDFNNQKIEIEYIESAIPLYESLKRLSPPATSEACVQVAVVFSTENVVISSHIEEVNARFTIPTPDGTLEISGTSADYKEIKTAVYTVGYRLVKKEDLEKIVQFQLELNTDPESKKIYLSSFAIIFILALVAVISMKNHTKEIAMAPTLPKASAPLEFKMTKTEFKKVEQMKKTEQAAATNPDPKNQGGGGGKKAKSVFSANSLSRLSTLVSKVSSQAARTKNIVVNTNGVSAGTAPSGRALASIGNKNTDGKNWDTNNKDGEYGVGTIGKGGSGVGGFGNLNGGKAGKAGIGLVENETEISGGLDREVIAQYIKSQLGQILYCYERQLSANPELFGKVAVRFTIAGSGAVEEQKIGDTTLKNKSVESCILSKVAKWKFPEPKGGTKVLVTYPFMFRSTN